MKALDSSGALNLAAIVEAKANGFTGFIRYVNGRGSLTAGEAQLVFSQGCDVASVYESSGSSGYAGSFAGQYEANAAIAGHVAAGGPKGVVIWTGAFDFDASNGALAQGYIDGYCGTMRAQGYWGGIYGPAGLARITHGWDAWWQTMSTGFFGNAYTTAVTMSQHFPQPVFGGIQFDENDIHDQARWGGWRTSIATPAPAPPPKPKGKLMTIFELPPGGLFVSDLETFRWLNGTEEVNTATFLLQKSGNDPTPVKVSKWQDMGVPADVQSANAAGAPWPPAAS